MPPAGDQSDLMRYLIPLGIVVVVLVLRNSRARRLKIERLWTLPAIYVAVAVAALYKEPPPLTPVSIAILVGAVAIGAAIGWQRGRLIQIHIHPETHELTSRASVVGMIFIFAVLALRIVGRDLLSGQAEQLHLPLLAITDAFLLLPIAMISVQRLEVWQRASRMLAEARAAAPGPPPPQSIVS